MGTAGVVVSYKIPILVTRVRFPGSARFIIAVSGGIIMNHWFLIKTAPDRDCWTKNVASFHHLHVQFTEAAECDEDKNPAMSLLFSSLNNIISSVAGSKLSKG